MLAILVLLAASRGLPAGNASPSNSTVATTGVCVSAIQGAYTGMNTTDAVANALASSLYANAVASYYHPTFDGIFQIAETISTSTCQQQVESYNVVFLLFNSTESLVANLVITESQNLSILGSYVQPDRPTNTYDSFNYAGYEVYYTGGLTDYIYATWTDYTQPTPSYPGNCSNGGTCEVNSWTGIGTGHYLGAYLAQAGTTSTCDQSGCTTGNGEITYFAWYEIVAPSGPTQTCNSSHGGAVTINGGDTIYTTTQNNVYGGGSDTEYTFLIEDTNTNTSCYAPNIPDGGYATNPTYAYYETEDPISCSSSQCTLAKFGSVSFTSAGYDDYNLGSEVGIYTAVNNGDYQVDQMYNGVCPQTGTCTISNCISPTQNIDAGSVSSSDDFTNTWDSSTYSALAECNSQIV